MGEPTRAVELYDASESLWDASTQAERENILIAAGHGVAEMLDFSEVSFSKLAKWAQRDVVRLVRVVREKLAQSQK